MVVRIVTVVSVTRCTGWHSLPSWIIDQLVECRLVSLTLTPAGVRVVHRHVLTLPVAPAHVATEIVMVLDGS